MLPFINKLYISFCNIETKGLRFNSEIEFKFSSIVFNHCLNYNGESTGLNEVLENIVEAISNSQLKDSLKKFWFNCRDEDIKEDDVKWVLEKYGLSDVILDS